MTVSGIRGLEKRGVLRPHFTGKRHVFSESDLAAAEKELVAERTRGIRSVAAVDGEIAAAVFEAFRRGVGLPDIVISHRLPPVVVRELWREFTTPLEVPPKQAPEATRKGKGR